MPEYIERNRLLCKVHELFIQPNIELWQVVNLVSNAPTADVVEVRHGEWKKRGNEKTCSECKFIYYSNNDEWSFCPNCGAKMDGKGG